MIKIRCVKFIFFGSVMALAGFFLWSNLRYEDVRIQPEIRSMAEIKARMAEAPAEWVGVLGTGSMAPLIPAGRADEVVAYAHFVRVPFISLKAGDLVVFKRGSVLILHALAELDSNGWITGGIHNKRYDSGRVTVDNFVGAVDQICVIDDLFSA